jgi:uncharacterized membrane protein YdfJ with MMPL/SSD domain
VTFRTWAVLALCVVLAAAGLGYYSGHKNQQINKALQQSQELKGRVNALQEQARVAVDQADAAAATAAQHEATARALKAKLAKLQAVPAAPGVSDPMGVVGDDLRDQIITAQDSQIAAQKDEIKGLRAALDLKDRALVTAEQRARGLELALEAQKHASKSQRWLGRIEGVAVGIAIGYVGGKLQ